MNLGVVGMIGGAGVGLGKESDYLYKQDEAEAADKRKVKLETTLADLREQYQIRAEGRQEEAAVRTEGRAEDRTIRTEQRTDTRSEEQKNRDFERLQGEAGTRRGIKVEDEKAAARGKSEVAAETADQDAAVTNRQAEAKETAGTKRLNAAHAGYYENLGEAAGTRADAAANKPGKDKATDELYKQRDELQKDIRKAKLNGTYDPKNPDHQAMDDELRGLNMKIRKLGSEGAGAAADPQGLRAKAQGTAPAPSAPAPAGGARKSAMSAQPGDADRAMILNQEYRKATQAAGDQNLTPDQRQRAQIDAEALQHEARAAGVTLQSSVGGVMPTSMIGPGGGPGPLPGPLDAAKGPSVSSAPAAAAAAAPAAQPKPGGPSVPAPAAAAPPPPPPKPAGQDPLGALFDQGNTQRELDNLTSKAPTIRSTPQEREAYSAKVESLRSKLKGLNERVGRDNELAQQRDREQAASQFRAGSSSGRGPAVRYAAP